MASKHFFSILVPFMMVCILVGAAAGDDSSLQSKCSEEFNKLAICLDYATGKADVPSTGCCSGTADIRSKDPVCLCYIIQQTHNGLSSIKSLGIQFARLVQLPGACKLAYSITDCPKLLNIPPSSPDYSIFTNATKASTPSTSTGSATASPSAGVMQQVFVTATLSITVLSAVFLSVFQAGRNNFLLHSL